MGIWPVGAGAGTSLQELGRDLGSPSPPMCLGIECTPQEPGQGQQGCNRQRCGQGHSTAAKGVWAVWPPHQPEGQPGMDTAIGLHPMSLPVILCSGGITGLREAEAECTRLLGHQIPQLHITQGTTKPSARVFQSQGGACPGHRILQTGINSASQSPIHVALLPAGQAQRGPDPAVSSPSSSMSRAACRDAGLAAG